MEKEIKRGRGRPRKYPISTEPKIKRPRGRPRKEVDEAELTKEKRPRGRPRKPVDEQMQNKPKRPRGRPRKNQYIDLEKEVLKEALENTKNDFENERKSEIVPNIETLPQADFDGAEYLFDEPMQLNELEKGLIYEDYDESYEDIINNTDVIEPLQRRSIKEVQAPKIASQGGVAPAKRLKSEPIRTYEEKEQEIKEVFGEVEEPRLNISTPHSPMVGETNQQEKPIRKTKNTNKTKVVLITGATSGLGLAMAKNLSALGQVVLAVGRRPTACREALNEIKAQYPDAKVHFLVADLSLMSQVRILIDDVKQKIYDLGYDALDVLIHNAGIQTNEHKVTYENRELMWATNYLSAFLLTKGLQPLLDASHNARVILTTNDEASKTKLDWENIRALTPKANDDVYNQTKLADLMFALEYDHKYADRDDLHAYCVNPGKVGTELRTKNTTGLKRIFAKLGNKKAKTIDQGIETTMYLCLAERLPKNMVYYENKKPSEPSKFALDPRNRSALWRYTELELEN